MWVPKTGLGTLEEEKFLVPAGDRSTILGHPKLSGHKLTGSKVRLTAGRNTETARRASEPLRVTLGPLTALRDQ